MTAEDRDPKVEPRVHFLNVDLELSGACDWARLLRGFGSSVFVLDQRDGRVSMELGDPNPVFPDAVWRLVNLVRALPEDAQRDWRAATSRVFSIGIQAGLEPRRTEWALPAKLLAALAEIGADVTLTVYGANAGHT